MLLLCAAVAAGSFFGLCGRPFLLFAAGLFFLGCFLPCWFALVWGLSWVVAALFLCILAALLAAFCFFLLAVRGLVSPCLLLVSLAYFWLF